MQPPEQEQAWVTSGPQVQASRPAGDDLQRRALAAPRRLPWTVVADRTALERSGTG